MTTQEMFSIKKVTKQYGETTALSSLSLRIDQGEVVAIIGPSGAGKTTLLNLLAHIEQPNQGQVHLAGHPISGYSTGKSLSRQVGVMRQQYDLIGALPVIHNVLAGRLGEWGLWKSIWSYIIPQDRERAAHALDIVGLKDKWYEKTSFLSGGEQQRVALARLLVQNPRTILADEPVSSLDPARAQDILSMLVRLGTKQEQTILCSLHSVEWAKKYFHRLVALKNGRIFFDQPSEKVTENDLKELYRLTESREHEETT